MTKPKQGGPHYEVPTEWRRIVMEEDKDGNVRPVAVEEAPIGSGVHIPENGAPTSTSEAPPDMPQEWHDILQSSSPADHQGISLVGEGQDVSEHTIPGMQIPQIFDDELNAAETNTGYAIDLHGSPVQERTTVGAPPPPPPEYEEFPFSSEPEVGAEVVEEPKKTPLIVPAQDGNFAPPPESVLPPEEGAALGVLSDAGASTPPTALPAIDEIPVSTIEMDVPPEPEFSESTNELDAHYAEPNEQDLEQILSAEDLAVEDDYANYSESEAFGTFDDEDTGAYSNLDLLDPNEVEQPLEESIHEVAASEEEEATGEVDAPSQEPLPAPVAPVVAFDPEVVKALLTPMFEEIVGLQLEALGQFDRLQQDLGIQHEAQEEAQQKLEEIASTCEQQSDVMKRQSHTLARVSDVIGDDSEERKFHALQGILQDLLLLFDFIDLRVRSLWDQYGQDHPSYTEMSAIRDRLLELLKRHDLSPIEISDSAFDPDSQRALQEILTMEPNEDGQISRIFRQGFRYKERVFRPSEVEVKRYPTS